MANDLRNLTVRLSLDRMNFDQGLSSVNRALNTLRGELNATRSGMGGFESESDRIRERIDVLGRTIQAQEEKVRQLRVSYDQAAAATGEDSRATQIYAAQVNRAVAELNRMQGELTQTTEQLHRMETSTTSFSQHMETMGNRLQNAGMQIGMVFGSIAYAVGGALKEAITTGAEFESEIAKVGSKSDASAADLKKLSDAAIQMAPLAGGAKNAATAMDDLAAKGYSVNQIITAMPGILSAANASGEDLALTSDTITSALEAFHMKATDTSHVADVLAKTANLTAAGMSDLQYTFKYAAAPAAQLGISMEQLAAMTGLMANQGIKGEQAGTSLREAMLRLVNPPKAAANELHALGVKVTDNQGKFRSFSDIIGDLNKSTEKMTNAQRAAAIEHIFGINAVSGMLAVMSGGKPKIDQFTDALVKSDGASAKAAAQMQDNFAGSLKKLNGAMDAAKIGIEQALAPALRVVADTLQRIVVAFNNLSPGMKQFIAISLAVTAIIATIGATLGIFLAGLGGIISAIGSISAAIAAAGGAAAIFSAVIAAITGPIGLIIAAIVALIVVFDLLWKNNEGFRNAVIKIWDEIVAGFNAALKWIMNIVHLVMDDVVTFATSMLNRLKEFWMANGQAIQTATSAIFSAIWGIIQADMQMIKGIFQVIWPIISAVVQIAWGVIKAAISTALDVILGIITFWKNVFTGNWKGIWTDAQRTFQNIWNDIQNAFKNIDLGKIGQDIINGLVNGLSSMGGAIKTAVKNLAKLIPDGIKKLLGIASPSKVTMELGGYVSEGLAIGMDSNAHKVLAASNNLANNAVPNINQTSNVSNGNSTGQSSSTSFEGLFSGANFYVRNESDIQALAKELGNYMKQKGRGKGVVML